MGKIIILVVGLAVGASFGFYVAVRPAVAPSSEEVVDASQEAETLRAKSRELEDELESLRASRDEAGAQNEELLARIGDLERELDKKTAVASEPVEVVALEDEDTAMPVAFGEFADLEELAGTDWQKLADAILTMTPEIVDLLAKLEAGEAVDQAAQLAIAKENQKLVGFALSVIGKLPTHAPANGEYTHPIALSNMLAKTLESSDVGLTDSQRAAMARLGEDYESEWHRVNDNYGDDTYAMQKLLDEVEMKADFMGGVHDSLSHEQLGVAFPESTRNRNRLDLFSPALMLVTNPPLPVKSLDDLQGRLMETTAQGLGVDAEVLAQHEGIFSRWVQDMSGHMGSPVRAATAGLYDLDTALAAGRAQLRAMEELAAQLDLSEEQLTAMRAQQGFVVPRLVSDE